MPQGPIPPTCPKCNSPDIRSFKILYEQGANTSTSVGITLSGEIGGMLTSGKTLLATATQPPARGDNGCLVLITLISSLAIGLLVFSSFATDGLIYLGGVIAILTFIGGIYIAISSSKAANLNYEEKLYKWRNSWCCLKCGYRFQILDPKANR